METKKQEVLFTAKNYIKNLKLGIKEAAELFQSYDEGKGSAVLYEIIDGLQWISEVIVVTQLVTDEEIIQMNEKLKEIVDAYENEDFILIGDLLFYEVLPIIDEIELKINRSLNI